MNAEIQTKYQLARNTQDLLLKQLHELTESLAVLKAEKAAEKQLITEKHLQVKAAEYRQVKDKQLQVLADLKEVNAELKAIRADENFKRQKATVKRQAQVVLNSLVDLKNFLASKFEVKHRGIALETTHGRWDIINGNIRLNKQPLPAEKIASLDF